VLVINFKSDWTLEEIKAVLKHTPIEVCQIKGYYFASVKWPQELRFARKYLIQDLGHGYFDLYDTKSAIKSALKLNPDNEELRRTSFQFRLHKS